MLAVWYGALFILLAIGLSELFGLLERWALRSKEPVDGGWVLPMSGHVEQAEYQVRSLVTRCRWKDKSRRARCVVVDEGMDGETRQICELLCRDFPCLTLCGQGDKAECSSANKGLQSKEK